MKTKFRIITFTDLVENQNKAKETMAALFHGYCFQRVGPALLQTGVKPVVVGLRLLRLLLEGDNAMLKRAFHEGPRQVSTLLLLKSNDGFALIFFDLESDDCGEGLCRFLTPLARTDHEQRFVCALNLASQAAKQMHRAWIQGGRHYHPLSDEETFEATYPEAACLAGLEAEPIATSSRAGSS